MNTFPILHVDDDALDAKTVRRAFKAAGIPAMLIRAENGAHALEILQNQTTNRPQLVLTDLRMPVMDGFELLRTVRAEAGLKVPPMVVLTTSSQPTDRDASYALGAAGYFVKPSTFDAFIETCKAIHAYWSIAERA